MEEKRKGHRAIRRGSAVLIAVLTIGVLPLLIAPLGGCGGGGSATSGLITAPNEATRSRVAELHDLSVRGITQSGFQTESLALARNGFFPGGGGGGALPPMNGATDSAGPRPMPMVGAFLRNVATSSPGTRAAYLHQQRGRQTTTPGEGSDSSPGQVPLAPPVFPDRQIEEPPIDKPEPTDPPIYVNPGFYFDYYLGLWVEVQETTEKSTYLLYEDEAKTIAAGSIVTSYPADWNVFPQVYSSTFEFTAGYLAGSHGSSENIQNADGSGRSRYENVYADGWKDKGASSWSGRGDYSWTSRTEAGPGEWTEGAGTFRADGSGGTRHTTSEGYRSEYTYNRDGSGRGRITGPDPGLPVTISWDAYGNTTIRYADGTVERVPGWGSGGGGGGIPRPVETLPFPDEEGSTPPPAP